MAIKRLKYETTQAYYQKIRKSNGHIQYYKIPKTGKNPGLARAVSQQSFAGASSHHIAPTPTFDKYSFKHFQTERELETYRDSVNVGHNITPPISILDFKEDLTVDSTLTELFDYIEERMIELHEQRDEYDMAYWSFAYTIVYDDGTANNYTYNTPSMDYRNPVEYWTKGKKGYRDWVDNILEAIDSYNDLIITTMQVKFRNGGNYEAY